MARCGRLVLFLTVAALAHGQLFFPEGNAGYTRLLNPKKAVIADVTATLTARTPWGEVKQVETGKYWRDKKGHIRQDDSHGFAAIIDLGQHSRSLIDRKADLILQDKFVPLSTPTLTRKLPRQESSVESLFFQGEWSPGQRAVVEGLKVTIRTTNYLGLPVEAWYCSELSMVLLIRYTTETTVFEQRYHNIRLEEPPSAVFEIPAGMRMVTDLGTVPPFGSFCRNIIYGISGARDRKRFSGTDCQ